MPIPVNYIARFPWGGAGTRGSNRPYTTIVAHGSRGSSVPVWGLLDTGADYLVLPEDIAHRIGINPSQLPPRPIIVADGYRASMRFGQVDISFPKLGKSAKVEVFWGPPKMVLIGRTAILGAMGFGIDQKGWLYL